MKSKLNLRDKEIILWVIRFDNDDFVYSYFKYSQALDAIRVFSEMHINSSQTKLELVSKLLENFEEILQTNGAVSVTLSIGEHVVCIHKIPFDRHSPIHKVLVSSYEQVDEKTKKSIEFLF